jgi:serine/threonine protein kinase
MASSRAAPPAAGSRKISFNVSEQYDIQDVVGEGAYGVVCSALHKPSGQKVAIKKIIPFDHSMFWCVHPYPISSCFSPGRRLCISLDVEGRTN